MRQFVLKLFIIKTYLACFKYIQYFGIFYNIKMSDQLSQWVCLVDQKRNLCQLDVQIFQQLQKIQQNQLCFQQDQLSLKCLKYIAQIQQNLHKKYQNKKIQQVDINSIHVPKKKRIRKIKQYKNENLNRKIKKHKLQLNRLWAMRLFHFLKGKSNNHFALRKINHFKDQMISAPNIIQLSKIFLHNSWISRILDKQKENFLNFIYCEQKISDQTKILLFQTFDILLQGIKHPESLVSWDLQLNRNIKESKQLLMKFKDKSYQEIHKLVVMQYQKQKEHYQSNKCSPHNNISYYWFKYLKDAFESEDFKSLYQSHQIYGGLQFIFCQSPTIMNIRNALSIKQLAQYILKNKIESKQILSQLVLNTKMNLLNKINMVITLDQFISAVKNPSSLHRWI